MKTEEKDLDYGTGPVLYYNEIVLDHVRNPRNVGEMAGETCNGFAEVGDPSCGDMLKLWIRVESGKIVDVKFKTFGCPGAISTSSMLTVLAKGKSIGDAKKLTDDDVVLALRGIPEHKKHCSLLGVTALHQAIRDYENRQNKISKQVR